VSAIRPAPLPFRPDDGKPDPRVAARPAEHVELEGRHQGNGPYGMATVIFGLALFVVSEALGWPDPGAITAVFERHP
jgi:hypothetical protein